MSEAAQQGKERQQASLSQALAQATNAGHPTHYGLHNSTVVVTHKFMNMLEPSMDMNLVTGQSSSDPAVD